MKVGEPQKRANLDYDGISRRLKEVISHRKTTKSKVAEECGVDRRTFGKAVNSGHMSVEMLALFCQRTGSSMDYIVLDKFDTASPEFQLMLKRELANRGKPEEGNSSGSSTTRTR